MVNTTLRKRLAALETNLPIQKEETLDKAVKSILDSLEAALPPCRGVQVQSPDYSHAYSTVGYVSHYTKLREMGLRLRAGTETADDRYVLAQIPDDALAVMGVDARGVIEWLMELDERI
jgi:hypothetical protein